MSVTLAFRPLDTPYPWPTADQAAFAAQLSADAGEYRIAQQLMGLACALKDREDTEALTSLTTALDVDGAESCACIDQPEQPRTPLRVAPYVTGPPLGLAEGTGAAPTEIFDAVSEDLGATARITIE